MSEKPLIAFIATYDDVADARQDYQEVKQAHSQGFIGEYDAAIVWKNDKGKIEIDSVSDEASRKWLWAGLGDRCADRSDLSPVDSRHLGHRRTQRRGHWEVPRRNCPG